MHSPTTSAARGPLASAVVAAVLLVLVLTSCSVRFDTPPDPVPTPDAAESLRAELAERTETLIAVAGAARSDDEDVAAELTAIATASEAQLAALGGIWTPPPRPGDASPTPSPTPEPGATPQDVLATLTDAATQVHQAVGAEVWDADSATLLASIALYRDGALSRLADALGVEAPEAPEPTEDLPAQLGPASTGLCRTLDGLGYALEVQAARSAGDQQDRAERRAARDRALAEQVAVLAGYDGTADDPRQVSYAVGEDLQETIETWQAQLVPAWLALVGPAAAEDRPLLLTQARAAAARVSLPADEAFPGLQPD